MGITAAHSAGSDPIAVQDVEMSYRSARGSTVTALQRVSLSVRKGEFLTLIGPSGCGKSTLLSIIGGLRRPTAGSVFLFGQPVTGPQPQRAAFVFQDYSLFPWLTVLDNVTLGLKFRGASASERRERGLHYLKLVELERFAHHFPRELSGGMQQRVALARALSMETDLLLMDEPFGALDEQTRMVLGEELARILERTSRTIVFVTHSLAEAVFLSDRIAVMSARPGRIKEIISVSESRPRQPAFMTADSFNRTRNRLYQLLHDELRQTALAELDGGGRE